MDTRFAQIVDARDDVIREAALDLAGGAIVGLPTECVYGLAARGLEPHSLSGGAATTPPAEHRSR